MEEIAKFKQDVAVSPVDVSDVGSAPFQFFTEEFRSRFDVFSANGAPSPDPGIDTVFHLRPRLPLDDLCSRYTSGIRSMEECGWLLLNNGCEHDDSIQPMRYRLSPSMIMQAGVNRRFVCISSFWISVPLFQILSTGTQLSTYIHAYQTAPGIAGVDFTVHEHRRGPAAL